MPPELTGKGWEGQFDRWLDEIVASTPGFAWHCHEPKMRGPIRVSGGLPDREIILKGRAYFFECKEESGTSLTVGRAIGRDDEAGNGIKPTQYREMDRLTAAGAQCFVAVLLDVPAAKERKQARLLGPPARKAEQIRRLIRWEDYRPAIDRREAGIAALAQWRVVAGRLMVARGANCELPPKPVVVASIPAADLATMGHPIRNAAELLAAIRGNP